MEPEEIRKRLELLSASSITAAMILIRGLPGDLTNQEVGYCDLLSDYELKDSWWTNTKGQLS